MKRPSARLIDVHTGVDATVETKQRLGNTTFVIRLAKVHQHAFIRNAIWVMTLLTTLTFTAALLVSYYGNMDFLFEHPVFAVLEAVLLLFVMIIFLTRLFNPHSFVHQWIGFILLGVISGISLCIITQLMSQAMFTQIYICVMALVWPYAIYCTQPWLGHPKLVLTIYSVIVLLVIAWFFIILPYFDFWDHPSLRWIHPDEQLVLQIIALGFSFLLITTIIWQFESLKSQYEYEQYIFAGCTLHVAVLILIGNTAMRYVAFRWDHSPDSRGVGRYMQIANQIPHK